MDADQQTDYNPAPDGEKPAKRVGFKPDLVDNKEEEEEEEEETTEFAVPQAREFMASLGFNSFDEVNEGKTLVHHCCYQSAKRQSNDRCFSDCLRYSC